jgi:hypothetical protein
VFLLKVLLLSIGLAVGIKGMAPFLSGALLSLPVVRLQVLALLMVSLPVLALVVLLQVRVTHKFQ